jgi:hypothetical protein
MDLVLIFLQTNQPPAADSHSKQNQHASQKGTNDSSCPLSSAHSDTNGAPSCYYEEDGKYCVRTPGDVSKVASEDWEQTEDFNGEEGEGEDVCGGIETRGQDC